MSISAEAASLTYDKILFTYLGEKKPAIKDVHIDVSPGELVVFVGPSGCGKSTLLRIAAGLLFPERGRLLIDKKDMLKNPPEKRRIGWVPQSYALFEHLNVIENVEFGLKMEKAPKEKRDIEVERMLKLCRIEDIKNRSVRNLSGGQRQRVAMARALAISPRVLLLDEPLAALDPQLRIAIREDLQQMLTDSGVTTLFVTHDQAGALALADKVVVLRNGIVEQIGSPEYLWNNPINDFVAEFLTNAITTDAKALDEDRAEILPGLVCSLNKKVKPGQAIRLALRKDDFTLSSDGVEAVITYCEYNGGVHHMKAETKDKRIIPISSNEDVALGTSVRVKVKDKVRITVIGE